MGKFRLLFQLLLITMFLLGCSNTNIGTESQKSNEELANEEKLDWTLDATFKHDNFDFIGKAGIIGVTKLSNNPNKFLANDESLFFWRLYGDPQKFKRDLGRIEKPDTIYGNDFKIIGLHKETNTNISLLDEDEGIFIVSFNSPEKVNQNGSGIQIQEKMSIPEKGTWKLMVYINQEIFDSVTVKVD